MANTFGNFMRGFEGARQQRRQDEEDAWRRQEREYLTGRRSVTDGREDTTWDQGQQDRQRTLSRDDQEYPLRFRSLEQGVALGDLGLQADRFRVERQPVEAQQSDALFAENIAGQRQMRGIRGAQEGRANAAHRIQMEMAELGLDDARLQAEHRQFVQTIGGPARRFALTGDPAPLSEAWRSVTGGDGNLVRQQDGSYAAVSANGEATPLGSREDVINALSMFAERPEAFLELRYQQQFGAGRQGGRQPAAIQEAEYIRSVLPRQEGESERDHAMRALDYRNRARTKPPEQEFREIMGRIIEQQSAMGGQADVEAAAAQARAIMSQSLRERTDPVAQQGPSRDGGSPPMPGAQRAPDGNWYVQQNGQWYRVD